MSEALSTAIRAEESAKAAHHRLDRMNGSIDTLGREVNTARRELSSEIAEVHRELSSEIAAARAEAKGQTASILEKLAHDDGREEGETSTKLAFLDDKRFWIGIVAVLVTSSLALFLFTLATRHPS